MTEPLFQIACPTCEARLNVLRGEDVGQILACPRCQSMVQVSPPPHWSAPDAEVVAEEPSPAAAEAAGPSAPRGIWLATGALGLCIVVAAGWWAASGAPSETAEGPAARRDTSSQTPPAVKPTADAEPRARETIDHSATDESDPAASANPSEKIAAAAQDGAPPTPHPDDRPVTSTDSSDTTASRVETSRDAPAVSDQPDESLPQVDEPREPSPRVPVPQPLPTIPLSRRMPRPDTEENETPPARSLEQRLAEQVTNVDFHHVPLDQFTRFLTNFTQIPITVDLASLQLAGVSASAPLSIAAKDHSIGELLQGALAPRQLQAARRAEQLTIMARRWPTAEVRRVEYRIADLTNEAFTYDHLQELLRAVTPADAWQAPSRLEIAGDKFVIHQTPTMHAALITFCEQLRLARDLPTLGRRPVTLQSRAHQTKAALTKRTTFNFQQPAPLVRIIEHLASSLEPTLLIDWESLGRADFDLATQVACTVDDEPFSVALSQLLLPIGLDWRPVDAGTLEIFAQRDAAGKAYTEFYPLPAESAAPQPLLDAIRLAWRGLPGTSEAAIGSLHWDRWSRHLIVRQLRSGHLAVEAELGQDREAVTRAASR